MWAPPAEPRAIMDTRITVWDALQGRQIRPHVVQGLFTRAARDAHLAYLLRAGNVHGAGEGLSSRVKCSLIAARAFAVRKRGDSEDG